MVRYLHTPCIYSIVHTALKRIRRLCSAFSQTLWVCGLLHLHLYDKPDISRDGDLIVSPWKEPGFCTCVLFRFGLGCVSAGALVPVDRLFLMRGRIDLGLSDIPALPLSQLSSLLLLLLLCYFSFHSGCIIFLFPSCLLLVFSSLV